MNAETLARLMASHAYAGNGKCQCDVVIGRLDGIVWVTDMDAHVAVAVLASPEWKAHEATVWDECAEHVSERHVRIGLHHINPYKAQR